MKGYFVSRIPFGPVAFFCLKTPVLPKKRKKKFTTITTWPDATTEMKR